MPGEEPLSAFLDASALYPSLLRNILMRCAGHDLYHAFWSARVQDEWTNAVLRDRPLLDRAKIARTRQLMDEQIDDASVIGYEHLIETITLPDGDDRHVLADVRRDDRARALVGERRGLHELYLAVLVRDTGDERGEEVVAEDALDALVGDAAW